MARVVLIGAGSSAFGYNMVLDAVNIPALRGCNMVLHDVDGPRLAAMAGLAERMNEEAGAGLEVESTTDRREALRGADYAVMSIAVERMRRWRMDWEIPFRHGVKQVIGENGGPGGLFHTLRNVPPVMGVARDMEELCPGAWLINYTNPVPRLCLAVSRHTEIKVVGLCHEVEHQLTRLAPLMRVPAALIEAVSAGLNHFSWFKELRLRDGSDAYPMLAEAVAGARGFQPLCRAMYDKFGLYPSTDDNHLGEYLAYAWDSCPPESRGLNWIERCEREAEKSWARTNRLLAGEEPLDVAGRLSGERAMHIVAGMESGSGHVEMQANLPNEGQVGNLMKGAIVETPAVVDRGGVRPVRVGDLPQGLAALCNIQILVGSLAVEAGVRGDARLARQALLADPVVSDTAAAEGAFRELMEAHRDLLPQFSEEQ
jgi:alpha-galactosidase